MDFNVVEREYRFLNIPSGDLRISITDMCNMQCSYCHNEGQINVCNRHFLTHEEVLRILDGAKKYGVFKVRLTGGEPLIHPDIEKICVDIKNRYHFSNLGINTNAYKSDLLIELCKKNLFDQVVIGLDNFSGKVSKDSPVGPSPQEVLSVAKTLQEYGCNVEIASVYMGDDANKLKLIEYCLKNKIMIKLIENTKMDRIADDTYYKFVNTVIECFDLKAGLTVDLNQLYALKNGIRVIKFFQSHCNRKECQLCRNLHMRVTAEGYAKPCLLRRDTEEYLLEPKTFDINMKKAIASMGKMFE